MKKLALRLALLLPLYPLLPFFSLSPSSSSSANAFTHGVLDDRQIDVRPHVHDEHEHSKRLVPSVPLTPPSSPLVWGDFNVIHTTDTHGWLLGHQKTSFPEPNYSGDFGDFASFVSHMKTLALEKNVDLLLVDSGDVHDGTGLSDGFPPGQVDAHASNQFIKQLPYDLLSIGNHELYIYANTLDMYTDFAPFWKGRYMSSNVNITVFDKQGEAVSVPVGERSVKFTTRLGRRITSLGVLYDFTGNDVNTTVQKVADMVKEEWFAEAIAEEPDLFVLIGHMPVREDNWPTVFNAVRAVHKTTPILIFGGHSHIRDCLQMDGRSIALESGRYMETVGFLSTNLEHTTTTQNLTFNRRYLDPNRVTYEYHTTRSNFTFDTASGKSITKGLLNLANQFDLSEFFGTAPQDYFLSRAPYPSNDSALTLFVADALPVALAINNTRASIPNIILTNSGELRFDIYSGPFDKNDQLTTLPFTDAFLYIPNITLSVAEQVLPGLNGASASDKRALVQGREKELQKVEEEFERYGRGNGKRYVKWLREMAHRDLVVMKRKEENLTVGYVTSDTCPGVGDDTAHLPLPFFDSPDYIASNTPNLPSSTPIDLVFINFIESDVLRALNKAQTAQTYTDSDVLSYTPILADAVLGLYAQQVWN